jgi:hypothetical protein
VGHQLLYHLIVCSASFPPLISTMLGKLRNRGTSESDTRQVQNVLWMVKQFPLEMPEQMDFAHSSEGSRAVMQQPDT